MDIRTEVRDWLSTVDWDTEITLTFANEVSQQQAERALRHFWNRVDWDLYGHAVRRYKKRCQRMCMMQGDGLATNYHFHVIAKCPKERCQSVEEFCKLLRKHWLYDNSNNFVSTFEAIRNKIGYETYISRQVKADNCDALILHSSHTAAH